MDFSNKLNIRVANFPLNTRKEAVFPGSSQAGKCVPPFKCLKSKLRPLKLPKLSANIQMNINSPVFSELFMKYSRISETRKLENLIQNKSKTTIIQQNDRVYVKSSIKKKIEEKHYNARSNQPSPIPRIHGNSNMPLHPASFHEKKISNTTKHMVDAGLNTDFD